MYIDQRQHATSHSMSNICQDAVHKIFVLKCHCDAHMLYTCPSARSA